MPTDAEIMARFRRLASLTRDGLDGIGQFSASDPVTGSAAQRMIDSGRELAMCYTRAADAIEQNATLAAENARLRAHVAELEDRIDNLMSDDS